MVKRQEELDRQHDILEKHKKEALEHERTLFDFDEDLNQLEGVEERYPVIPQSESTTKVSAATKTDETIPKDEGVEDQAKSQKTQQINNRFTVKRAVRPELPQSVLDDLAKIKGEPSTK